MVDALVCNHQPEEASALVKEIRADEACRDVLNTVVYSTLLKGFTQARLPQRVQDVYEEMKAAGISCNTITYNTMLDAHARTGRMDRAEALLADMQAASACAPDVITYSTLIKGYCHG